MATYLQTLGEIETALARVTMKHGPIRFEPPWVKFCAEGDSYCTIALTYYTVDRDTGLPITVTSPVTINVPVEESFLLRAYQHLIRSAYDHEFAEAYHIDGIRVMDPHPPPTEGLTKV